MAKKTKVRIYQPQQISQPPKQSVALFTAASFSGPLPPPEMLQRYNEVAPGLAERIVSMAEQQSAHRRTLERKVVYSNELRAHIGQFMAFTIALAGIAAGIYLTMNNKPTEGLTAILGPLLGIVGVFIYGKIAQRKDLSAKDRTVKRN